MVHSKMPGSSYARKEASSRSDVSIKYSSNPLLRVFYYLEKALSELKILFPSHETVKIGNATAKIYPVKLKDLEMYSQAAANLIALLADATVIKMTVYGAKHAAELNKLLLACTSLSRRQISRLSANDAILFGYQVVRVNFDFFAQALPEVIASLPDGSMPSKG